MEHEEVVSRLAKLDQWQESHEVLCNTRQRNTIWVIGIMIGVMAWMCSQLLLVTGRQEVVLSNLTDMKLHLAEIRADVKNATATHSYNTQILQENAKKLHELEKR